MVDAGLPERGAAYGAEVRQQRRLFRRPLQEEKAKGRMQRIRYVLRLLESGQPIS